MRFSLVILTLAALAVPVVASPSPEDFPLPAWAEKQDWFELPEVAVEAAVRQAVATAYSPRAVTEVRAIWTAAGADPLTTVMPHPLSPLGLRWRGLHRADLSYLDDWRYRRALVEFLSTLAAAQERRERLEPARDARDGHATGEAP